LNYGNQGIANTGAGGQGVVFALYLGA
jgi:hypothetical protein